MTNATVQLLARHVGIWEGDYTHIDPRDRGVQRARTWHWFRDEKLWRITLVRERRVSLDPFALPLDAQFPP